MRRPRASSGLSHSCVEGAESSLCIHHVIPTKSIIRVELEQQTYADSEIVHDPAVLIVQKGFRAFRRCLKGYLHLIPSCHGIVLSRSFWVVLEMVRKIPGQLKSETKISGRTARSNRRAGKIERADGSHGNVDCQRSE